MYTGKNSHELAIDLKEYFVFCKMTKTAECYSMECKSLDTEGNTSLKEIKSNLLTTNSDFDGTPRLVERYVKSKSSKKRDRQLKKLEVRLTTYEEELAKRDIFVSNLIGECQKHLHFCLSVVDGLEDMIHMAFSMENDIKKSVYNTQQLKHKIKAYSTSQLPTEIQLPSKEISHNSKKLESKWQCNIQPAPYKIVFNNSDTSPIWAQTHNTDVKPNSSVNSSAIESLRVSDINYFNDNSHHDNTSICVKMSDGYNTQGDINNEIGATDRYMETESKKTTQPIRKTICRAYENSTKSCVFIRNKNTNDKNCKFDNKNKSISNFISHKTPFFCEEFKKNENILKTSRTAHVNNVTEVNFNEFSEYIDETASLSFENSATELDFSNMTAVNEEWGKMLINEFDNISTDSLAKYREEMSEQREMLNFIENKNNQQKLLINDNIIIKSSHKSDLRRNNTSTDIKEIKLSKRANVDKNSKYLKHRQQNLLYADNASNNRIHSTNFSIESEQHLEEPFTVIDLNNQLEEPFSYPTFESYESQGTLTNVVSETSNFVEPNKTAISHQKLSKRCSKSYDKTSDEYLRDNKSVGQKKHNEVSSCKNLIATSNTKKEVWKEFWGPNSNKKGNIIKDSCVNVNSCKTKSKNTNNTLNCKTDQINRKDNVTKKSFKDGQINKNMQHQKNSVQQGKLENKNVSTEVKNSIKIAPTLDIKLSVTEKISKIPCNNELPVTDSTSVLSKRGINKNLQQKTTDKVKIGTTKAVINSGVLQNLQNGSKNIKSKSGINQQQNSLYLQNLKTPGKVETTVCIPEKSKILHQLPLNTSTVSIGHKIKVTPKYECSAESSSADPDQTPVVNTPIDQKATKLARKILGEPSKVLTKVSEIAEPNLQKIKDKGLPLHEYELAFAYRPKVSRTPQL